MGVSTITFFPVDNGGMSLLKLNDENETTFLTDIYIREISEDEDDNIYDVASYLLKNIKEKDGVPYVDVFLLTHNDEDHIKGLQNYFYLGDPSEYPESEEGEVQKILIKEIWGSTRFWKRSSESNKLCDDAKAFNREMKRRVTLYEDSNFILDEGNRVKIIGLDPDGKTDGLEEIVIDIDEEVSILNEIDLSDKLTLKVLGPIPQQENESDEDFKKSNRASVIISLSVTEGENQSKVLLTGDAEVFVWDCLWSKYKNSSEQLEYDVLLAPHHCSWHSLSYDSQTECDEPEVSSDAKSALSQAIEGAFIISSSKPIKDDDNDPPSFAAKEVYLFFIDESHFLCTQEYPSEENLEPIIINLTSSGPQRKSQKSISKLAAASTAATGEAFPHGREL